MWVEHTGRTGTTRARRPRQRSVLGGGPVTGALAGRASAARAARTRQLVLSGRFGAGAVQGRLLAARAGGLLG